MNQLGSLPQSILSVIPSDQISQSVLHHVHVSLQTPIFNHSLRVYLLATQLYKQEHSSKNEFTHPSGMTTQFQLNPQQLFAASMFHDMGTCPACNGPQRFEVEGGDAAVTFLRSQGFEDNDILHGIWSAISLHTSVGIAERIDPFTRLLRVAVKADFAPTVRDKLGLKEYAAEIERGLPRLGIEACLARAVLAQSTRGELEQGLYVEGRDGVWTDSVKFPKASWPGILVRGHLEKVRDKGESWEGENPAF